MRCVILVRPLLLGLLATSAFGQSSGGSRAACQPRAGRPGSEAWVRRNESILQPEKQVQLKPGGLVGFVVDPDGTPIEGVAVLLTPGEQPPGDTARRRMSATNHSGVFSFDSIQRATCIIRVMRLGMNSQWQEYHGVRGIIDTLCIEMRMSGITLPPITIGRPPL